MCGRGQTGGEQQDSEAGAPQSTGGATVRRIALWAGLLLCVVFTALAVWSFVQFDRAIENPQEGGFSGWMCDAGRDCGS